MVGGEGFELVMASGLEEEEEELQGFLVEVEEELAASCCVLFTVMGAGL